MGFHAAAVLATPLATSELERFGDEIAELSAHLDAATVRFLAPIRDSTPEAAGTRVRIPLGPPS